MGCSRSFRALDVDLLARGVAENVDVDVVSGTEEGDVRLFVHLSWLDRETECVRGHPALDITKR
jgi:hypothetical protein